MCFLSAYLILFLHICLGPSNCLAGPPPLSIDKGYAMRTWTPGPSCGNIFVHNNLTMCSPICQCTRCSQDRSEKEDFHRHYVQTVFLVCVCVCVCVCVQCVYVH